MTSLVRMVFVVVAVLLAPLARAQEECSLPASENSAIDRLCAAADGMMRLRINHRWGYADLDGHVAVEPRFAEAADFSEGLAVVQGEDEKWGVIDRQGKWVLQPQYDSLGSFAHGRAAAGKDGKEGYIDRSGRWVIAAAYETVGPFNGATSIVSESYRHDLLLDASGQVLKRFEPGTSLSSTPNPYGLYLATVAGKTLMRHRDGRTLPSPLAAAYTIRSSEGLIVAPSRVQRGDTPIDLFGAVDVSGKWIVPAKFRGLEPFESGLAIAQADDGDTPAYGLIDKQGRYVVEPQYSQLTRASHGWYTGKRANGAVDVFSTSGERLIAFDCSDGGEAIENNLSEASEWSVLKGCGQTWVIADGRRAFRANIAPTEVQATPRHVLLTNRPEGADDSKQATTFEIFDSSGKRLLSHDDVKFTSAYDYVVLLAPATDEPASQKAAGPLALLVRKFEKVEVVTQDLRIVSDTDWQYDSAINNYSYSGASYRREAPLPLKSSAGWGAIDGQGRWVIQPKYSELSTFRSGMAFARKDGTEYVVDAAGGEHAFPENGRQFERVGPDLLVGRGNDGEIVHFEPAKGVVSVHPVAPDLNVGDFRGGLAVIRNNDYRSGLIDTHGRIAVPLNYAEIEPLNREGSAYGDVKMQVVGWRIAQTLKTDNGELRLHGWLDASGKEVFAPQYDEITLDTASQTLLVKRESRAGVLGLDGRVLLEPKYGEVSYAGDGWYAATEPERQGLVDAKGEWVSPPDDLYLSDLYERGFWHTQLNRETVLFDAAGRRSTRAKPLQLTPDDPQSWWYPDAASTGGPTTFFGVDFRERVKVPGRVGVRARFSEGVLSFVPANATPQQGVGLIDATGKVLGLYPFGSIEPMQNGFAAFTQTKLARGAKAGEVSAATELSGYLDRSGKVAIPAQFAAATPFSEGRAAVVLQENIGIIDTAGKLLMRGAWLCGREPMIVDGAGRKLWPAEARSAKTCN